MSFSADKVPILKGAFTQRRFSSSKEPSGNGESFLSCMLRWLYFIQASRRIWWGVVATFTPFHSIWQPSKLPTIKNGDHE
jgi:hypothetical protein